MCAAGLSDNKSTIPSDKNTSWLPLQLRKPYLKYNKQEFSLVLQ